MTGLHVDAHMSVVGDNMLTKYSCVDVDSPSRKLTNCIRSVDTVETMRLATSYRFQMASTTKHQLSLTT